MKNIKKRAVIKVLSFWMIAIILFSSLIYLSSPTLFASVPREKYIIAIDPGHGGIDRGGTGRLSGIAESDINLAISLFLKDYLEAQGFDVVMTRTEDVGLYGDTSKGFKRRDMKRRKEIIEGSGAHLLVSVHCNISSSSTSCGVVAYYNEEETLSKSLAENIISNLLTLPETKKKGSTKSEPMYITTMIDCPAVIIECGFLSNAEEEALLSSEIYQKKLAKKIANGIFQTLIS